jgi:hypothetical protein
LSMDVRPFLNREYHSNVLDRLNAVSPNASCNISYVSYQVSGRIWCKHVAPSTHPFHNMMKGQTRLHCRSTQAASRSSGAWHQKMLPNILHGCPLDTSSSFAIKNFVPDIFDQTSYNLS